jgi:histidine ammonia-lyase
MQVVGDGGRGLIVTVQAADVDLDLQTTASTQVIKKALRKAIEPVTGDAVSINRWETVQDAQGVWSWRVWARR